ncbi:uncharacterized protein LY79DRAFT_673370 [Colletotrichum navitas]|uniref:Secreted protein n=1 Tax=Colletotrichum navitas TaxID=681940 RepID=A0AAD8PPC7_9PEZI|nr:uncharacterized protein LY79DRAFT_673370 [Colletotrichum navitas]KAK1573817.1 hypothetical protein LY79DRAFT_673370 [Colletotrichum navitas]
MKHSVLVLALLFVLGITAAQVPLKPPAYYGAPSTPKKKRMVSRRSGTGPHIARAHTVKAASIKKPEIAAAKKSDKQSEGTKLCRSKPHWQWESAQVACSRKKGVATGHF